MGVRNPIFGIQKFSNYLEVPNHTAGILGESNSILKIALN